MILRGLLQALFRLERQVLPQHHPVLASHRQAVLRKLRRTLEDPVELEMLEKLAADGDLGPRVVPG